MWPALPIDEEDLAKNSLSSGDDRGRIQLCFAVVVDKPDEEYDWDIAVFVSGASRAIEPALQTNRSVMSQSRHPSEPFPPWIP